MRSLPSAAAGAELHVLVDDCTVAIFARRMRCLSKQGSAKCVKVGPSLIPSPRLAAAEGEGYLMYAWPPFPGRANTPNGGLLQAEVDGYQRRCSDPGLSVSMSVSASAPASSRGEESRPSEASRDMPPAVGWGRGRGGGCLERSEHQPVGVLEPEASSHPRQPPPVVPRLHVLSSEGILGAPVRGRPSPVMLRLRSAALLRTKSTGARTPWLSVAAPAPPLRFSCLEPPSMS